MEAEHAARGFPVAGPPDGGASTRDQSIDVARGITIIAIVLGHVVLGLMAAGHSLPEQAEAVARGFYLFRLPTLAYVSGLFVLRGVERLGRRELAIRRALLFGWLYVLWSLIQGSVKALAGSRTNAPMAWGDVLRLWVPDGQLWFLPCLVSLTLVAMLIRPWVSTSRALMAVAGAGVVALAVWGLEPAWVFAGGWALLVPFLAGCAVGARTHARMFGSLVVVSCLAVGGAAIWAWVALATSAVPPTLGGDGRTPSGVALGVLGCIAGTAACLAWAGLLARTPVRAVLAPIGRRSLEVFLAHIVVASGTRILLAQAGIADLAVHLVLGVALGVLVPIALAVVAERLGWGWVFGLPSALRRA